MSILEIQKFHERVQVLLCTLKKDQPLMCNYFCMPHKMDALLFSLGMYWIFCVTDRWTEATKRIISLPIINAHPPGLRLSGQSQYNIMLFTLHVLQTVDCSQCLYSQDVSVELSHRQPLTFTYRPYIQDPKHFRDLWLHSLSPPLPMHHCLVSPSVCLASPDLHCAPLQLSGTALHCEQSSCIVYCAPWCMAYVFGGSQGTEFLRVMMQFCTDGHFGDSQCSCVLARWSMRPPQVFTRDRLADFAQCSSVCMSVSSYQVT